MENNPEKPLPSMPIVKSTQRNPTSSRARSRLFVRLKINRNNELEVYEAILWTPI